MRISTLQFYKNNTQLITSSQQSLLLEQQKIATGKEVQSPSDDPVVAAQLSLLESRLSRTERYTNNANLAQDTLSINDSNLSILEEIGIRLKEIQIRSVSALNDEARAALSIEAREILNQMVSIANTKDSNGRYVYGGNQSMQSPITQSATGYVYNGDDGQQHVSVSNSLQVAVSDSGFDLFMDLPSANHNNITINSGFNTGAGQPQYQYRALAGSAPFSGLNAVNGGTAAVTDTTITEYGLYTENIDDYFIHFDTPASYLVYDSNGNTVQGSTPYTAGNPIEFNGLSVTVTGVPNANDNFHIKPTPRESVFDTVQRMVDNLNTPQAAVDQKDNDSILFQVNNLINHFTDFRTTVGARHNTVEKAQLINEEVAFSAKKTISLLRDTDMVEAISELNAYSLSLQAAQQSFAKIQQLSLFNFI